MRYPELLLQAHEGGCKLRFPILSLQYVYNLRVSACSRKRSPSAALPTMGVSHGYPTCSSHQGSDLPAQSIAKANSDVVPNVKPCFDTESSTPQDNTTKNSSALSIFSSVDVGVGDTILQNKAATVNFYQPRSVDKTTTLSFLPSQGERNKIK